MRHDDQPVIPEHGYFTVAEVAALFRVTTTTIHRMIGRGELRVVRMGERKGAAVRIPRAEVLRLRDQGARPRWDDVDAQTPRPPRRQER